MKDNKKYCEDCIKFYKYFYCLEGYLCIERERECKKNIIYFKPLTKNILDKNENHNCKHFETISSLNKTLENMDKKRFEMIDELKKKSKKNRIYISLASKDLSFAEITSGECSECGIYRSKGKIIDGSFICGSCILNNA